MSSDFVHLHSHSEYSLLDGAIKVERLVERAKELEMPAVALTDHGNMFGAIKFYKTARKAGIKPLVGMEAYVTRSNRFDKTRKMGELAQINHLILLARNRTGYQNLMKLSSYGYTEGFYYKPRIDWELLAGHADGLVAMSACLKGDIPQTILHEGFEEARRKVDKYIELFGRDNYFLELQDHGIDEEARVREGLIQIARETKIALVATNDAHYLNREDAEAHECLLCLQTGTDFEDPKRFRFSTNEVYFKTPDEMRSLFADMPEAIENTMLVADRCDLQLEQDVFHLPKFPLPDGYDNNSAYLRDLAYKGAQDRFGEVDENVEKRLEYELSVIKKMDYDGYFLIVRDIVDFARREQLPVGPGRGSAAGSLLCYTIGITDVDPMANDLLFERMLNPERVSMPDIDIDFCFERREEVIKYVIERYGEDKVCQIITFGTMAARGVVRDVGRVLKIPYGDVDRMAKLIPGVPGTTLDEAYRNVPELKTIVEADQLYERLWRLCTTLEGLTRHASIHAAGMIITPTPLMNHVPLYKNNKGEVTSQYDMKSAEAVGVLKVDILGLRTLTVIDKAVRMIARNHGVTIDPSKIPLDDEKTFAMLQEARTVGIFQLESSGMRELLKSMKPESFSDIVAVNALYRPGPLDSGMDKQYVECKHGRKKITYEHASLEPILKETYGVILYQEQVMRIASALAGFSLGGADILRKAMGKKDHAVMAKQRKSFVDGAVANGIPKAKAEKIFSLIEKFARYGFNKSHSAAYAMISVRTAYLKASYPAEFLAANMTSEIDDSDRIAILIDDARELTIKLQPPEINTCDPEFKVVDGTIYYGLAAVKNVGMNAIKHVCLERQENGAFKSLYDFCSRVSSRAVNKRVVESLIHVGAFDAFGHRAQLLDNLERIMEKAARSSRDAEKGQFSMFANDKTYMDDELGPCDEWAPQDRLRHERESLGFFLTGHPLDRYRDALQVLATMTTAELRESPNGKHAIVGGVVSTIKNTMDRKQQAMAFVTIEDRSGQAETVIFSDVLAKHKQLVVADHVVLLEGKVSSRGGEGKLLVSSVQGVSDDRPPDSKEVHLSLDLDLLDDGDLGKMKDLLSRNQGSTELYFHLKEKGKKACVVKSRSLTVRVDYDLLAELCGSIGAENIKLVRGSARIPS